MTKIRCEDAAEVAKLNRRMTRGYWLRVLAMFLVSLACAYAVLPKGSWSEALAVTAAVWVFVVVGIAYPWFNYRYLSRNAAWKVYAFSISLLVVAGLSISYVLPLIAPELVVTPGKLARVIGLMVLLGAAMSSLLVSVSRVRVRESDERAARLQAENERERLQARQAQAELKVLQAQVEPHFLFNTLANVRHLMATEPAGAIAMLDHLIQYLRTALPEIRAEGSTLGREVELARAYLEIMRLRMGGALTVAIEVPEELRAVPFPSLMLMTLVENAIKHGVGPAARGTVAIRASESAGKLRVTVEDDGAGLGGTIGVGVGLVNVRERLAALFGGAARLDLASAEGGGARATIEVPVS